MLQFIKSKEVTYGKYDFSIIIPRLAFISFLGAPFYNRQSQLSFVVNTALLKHSQIIELDYLSNSFNVSQGYPPLQDKVMMTLYYITSNTEEQIESYHAEKLKRNISMKYINIRDFAILLGTPRLQDEMFKNRCYFIFIGFNNWNSIVRDVYNINLEENYGYYTDKFPVMLTGGDTARRHLVNHSSIKLHFFLSIIFKHNEVTMLDNIILKADKKFIAPNFDFHKRKYIGPSEHFPWNLEEKECNVLSTKNKKSNLTNNINIDLSPTLHSNSENEDETKSEANTTKDYLLASDKKIKYTPKNSLYVNQKREHHTVSSQRAYSSDKPKNLSFFLERIEQIINENKNDTIKAQRYIEEKWIEIAYNSFNFKASFFKKSNNIFNDAWDTLSYINKKGIFKRNYKELAPLLIDYKHLFITFSFLITFHSKTSETNLASMIGRNIFISIYNNHFKKSINNDKVEERKFESFNDFCNHFLTTYNHNEYFIRLGTTFIDIFTTQIGIQVFERRNQNDEGYFISINKEYINEIQNNLIINPQSLPMISQPILWSDKNYGGFLLNSDSEKALVTGSEHHSHCLQIDNKTFNSVNYLNSLKFKINGDFLKYLHNEGSFILDHYKKNKGYINNIIALDIATIYKDIAFYLNVNLDWRGRIYTHSFYLDYQGSDFSLALIDLYKGEKLTKQGLYYYYIYGANCYNENNISKSCFEDRYNWVIENSQKIYSMDKNFILEAESPALFAAFCINFRKIKDNPDYIHFTPCFLDATCSGIQHFAAMLLDHDLAYNVNLIKSEKVQDLYTTLIDPINKAINESWQHDPKLIIFSDIKLTRKELKKLIMVKSYNVTVLGMVEHLKAILEKKEIDVTYKNSKGEEKIVKDYLYYVKAKNTDGFVLLNDTELLKLANIINQNIFNRYNSLKSIYLFLTQLTKCMLLAEIPVTWGTPLGLEITQHYNSSRIRKISINFLGKNKTTVLREWTKDLDKRKQLQAIIPNIIHSFDASHLIQVISQWDKDKYILPIHDCFGTHPNDMFNLSQIIKREFVRIYADYKFIEELRKHFINDLKKYRIETIEKNGKEYIKIKRKNRNEILEIPQLPEKGTLNIQDVLESNYIIS